MWTSRILMRLSRPIRNQVANFGPGPTVARVFMLAPKNLKNTISRHCDVLVSPPRTCTNGPNGILFSKPVAALSSTFTLEPTMLDALGIARTTRHIPNLSLQLQEPSHRDLFQRDSVARSYPDPSAVNMASSGALFGRFAAPALWNSNCAEGRIAETPR